MFWKLLFSDSIKRIRHGLCHAFLSRNLHWNRDSCINSCHQTRQVLGGSLYKVQHGFRRRTWAGWGSQRRGSRGEQAPELRCTGTGVCQAAELVGMSGRGTLLLTEEWNSGSLESTGLYYQWHVARHNPQRHRSASWLLGKTLSLVRKLLGLA